jgi:hypothetical protein
VRRMQVHTLKVFSFNIILAGFCDHDIYGCNNMYAVIKGNYAVFLRKYKTGR